MKIEKAERIATNPVEVQGAEGVRIRWLISKNDGAPNFAMRMFEVEPGGHTPLHAHSHEHEVFVVEGEGLFVCQGNEYPFSSEYVMFVPGNAEHQFKNTGNSVLKFLCIIPSAAG